jgi:hypothetical protein
VLAIHTVTAMSGAATSAGNAVSYLVLRLDPAIKMHINGEHYRIRNSPNVAAEWLLIHIQRALKLIRSLEAVYT